MSIIVSLINTETQQTATVEIPAAHAEAFRSGIQEIRNEVGERLAGSHRFPKEFALTRASSALGLFGKAVNKVIDREDPDYE
jgi:hypothetical protein